jgi:hypothetical protein
VDAETIKDCGRELEYLLQETDVVESKASLRSFIKRIEIARENAKVHYILPIPPDGKMRESLGVLPMVTSVGEGQSQTLTPFTAHDPKSCSSANSDTSPIGNHLIQ